MPQLSISQLAAYTGKDRRTVTRLLEPLDYTEGPDRAHLYDSELALSAIYLPRCADLGDGAPMTLDQARMQLAAAQTARIITQHESDRKERIPLALISELWDAALQSFAAGLKAARGKKLDAARINDLLAHLRSVTLPLKW